MGTRMEWMFGEIRVALRSLMRRPAFSATVVGTLAASLGAATIIFSVLEGVLLRPLPYPDASELVTVHGTNEAWRTHENWMFRNSWDRNRLSLDQVDAFRSSGTLASVGASARDLMIIREGGPAEEISVERVGRGVFETLGVEPLLGRLPSRDELDRGAAVLVLSEELWTGRFGRDPSVTGRSVTLQGEPFDIVGVLPAEFDFPDEVVKAWTTLPAEDLLEHRGRANYAVVGRLRPGGDLSAATTILAETMTTMATEDSAWDGIGVRLVPRAEEVLRQVRSGLLLLFGAVIVVETLVHDLSTYAAVSFVLGLAALVAALVPAFRTTSLEPARVLGRE